MNSVKIIIDKRSTKKDGTHPLKLRMVHQRQTYHLALGYSLLAKDWDEKGEKIKASCKTIVNKTRLNSLLLNQKKKAIDLFIKLEETEQLPKLSFSEIKSLLENGKSNSNLLAFANEVMNEMKLGGKVGNARVYKTMHNSVRVFLKDKDVPFTQITFKWLKKYEAWYLSRGNSVNGLAVNLRTLRALFNRAIKQQLVSKEHYPFDLYSIKKEKTRKRAVDSDAIAKLKVFVPTTQRQKRAKDYFFISFYLMGASFIDLAFLKLSNIKNGRVEYKRKKTGQLHSIKITDPLQVILTPYLEGKTKEDFLLNVLSKEGLEAQYIQVRDEMRRYNRSLKEIGKLCEIDAPLTSYVARHSFASIANNKKVPLKVISQALGHDNPKTTEIYLSAFNNETMDDYNEMIIGE